MGKKYALIARHQNHLGLPAHRPPFLHGNFEEPRVGVFRDLSRNRAIVSLLPSGA